LESHQDALGALEWCLSAVRMHDNVRGSRGLIGLIDTRQVLDFSGPGASVQSLGVPGLQDLEGSSTMHHETAPDGATSLLPRVLEG
jgi:hypothetical protein